MKRLSRGGAKGAAARNTSKGRQKANAATQSRKGGAKTPGVSTVSIMGDQIVEDFSDQKPLQEKTML